MVSVYYSLSSLGNTREWRDKRSRQGGTWQTVSALWASYCFFIKQEKSQTAEAQAEWRDPGVSNAIGFNKGAGADWRIKTAPCGSASLPVCILEIDGHSSQLTRLSLSIIN